jgi:hypothetical protein
MKKILLLIPIFALFNCGPEAQMFERQYLIENKSNTTIQLYFYLLSEPVNDFSGIELNKNRILEGKRFEFSKPVSNDSDYTGSRLSFKSDSAIIIFNNKRKLSIYLKHDMESVFSEPKNRNIYRHGNYESIENDQFLFKITEEDFENATPCDGDCD